MDMQQVQAQVAKLKENIERKVVGAENTIDHLLTALIAGGHVLLEDVPGVGKTTLAKSLADSLSVDFSRIQFTPDTLPSDVTGMRIYNMQTGSFEVEQGPVMHSIVLADEINRTSPKTQSALLEVMQERQVTIDGKTYPLPEPFMVVATQNPMDFAGTFPLPEAQLDRFMMKLSMGYPNSVQAKELARRFLDGRLEEDIEPVLTGGDVLALQQAAKEVLLEESLVDYAQRVVDRTRTKAEVRYGASPRALLDLLSAARSRAVLFGRDFVIPEDMMRLIRVVLPHRMQLTSEARMNHYTGDSVLDEILGEIKLPE